MFLDEGLGFLLHQFLGIQRQQITSDGARQFHGDPSIFSMIFVRGSVVNDTSPVFRFAEKFPDIPKTQLTQSSKGEYLPIGFAFR